MSVRMELVKVTDIDKNIFKPTNHNSRLSSFQMWSLEMLYACLYHESIKETSYAVKDVVDNCVWNGNELYNAQYQIFPDKNKQSRLWMSDRGVVVLELIDDDFNVPNEVYYLQ